MALFSSRHGYTSPKDSFQMEDIDLDLRNALWNALTITYWDNAIIDPYSDIPPENTSAFLRLLWIDFFNNPLDELSKYWSLSLKYIRKYFFSCDWYLVYDFIEFTFEFNKVYEAEENFPIICNRMLERENSGYRLIEGKITPITSAGEIQAIEEAFEATDQIRPAQTHLSRALELLSDRKAPDYRNSIKESISAVEALSQKISGKPKASLGDALKELEKKIPLHAALKKSFLNLYGYTSDAEGIRHALMDEPSIKFEDAKFMLVSCAGFVSYLIALVARADSTK